MSINGGFTLGGQTAKQLGMRMLRSSQRPILPGTVDHTLAIPGRNGLWDFGADLGARLFNLECVMLGTNSTSLQQLVSTLAAFLVDQYGKPRTLELIFDFQPDRAYQVRYSGDLQIDRVVGRGKFTLPLVAFDPYAYGDSDSHDEDLLYDIGLDYDDGLIYPNPEGFTWLYTEQHSSLYNYSALLTNIIITIDGTVAGPSIEHEQSGNTLNLPDLTGETLVIDTKKLTVKVDGMNALGDVSGDFFQIAPGENGFVFRCSSASASVVYDWKFKYL